jgi:mono/diheme cytochrome c family protein
LNPNHFRSSTPGSIPNFALNLGLPAAIIGVSPTTHNPPMNELPHRMTAETPNSERPSARRAAPPQPPAPRWLCFLVLGLLAAATKAAAAEEPVDFRRDVLPVLSQNCFTCHGPDAKTRKADLRLDVKEGALRTKDPVLIPGKSGESEVFSRVTSTDPDELMPPPKSGKKLTASQIEILKKWIDQGAPWKGHWAFEPIGRPAPPQVRDAAWTRNPIDRFVLAELQSKGLAPSPQADPATLLRRLSLDLAGVPPSPEEVDDFLAAGPNAYEEEADRLLASPLYGERMAMEWLDGARFADTNGYQNDFARTMWPWRDWVIAAYNRNQPFNQFLTEQLAGDLLPQPTQGQKIATGFNRNNRTVTEAGSIEEEWRIENAVDRVETTATVFLGLTMGCARCHDHKFDPVSQGEFYQFVGFFNSVNEQGVYTETRGNVPPLVMLPTPQETKRVKDLETAFDAAKKRAEKKEIDKLAGEKDAASKAITSVMVMEDTAKPRPTFVLKRGRYDMPDQSRQVEPGVPGSLPPLPKGAGKNRLGLAEWLSSPANPLTARVAVNRIWQHHFGMGLVKTAENFGVQGEPPSHPELLDWLANELIGSGWNIKALHRLIVTSSTFRQRSSASAAHLARDPENRLLAHGPRFRLAAEVVRDNALAISGLLVKRLGGPSVKPYQPAGLWEELAGGAGEAPYVQDKGAPLYRRSLYVYRKRTVPHPIMATFDAPSREVCQVKRPRTNTPLQALELLNDMTYVEAARQLAQRAIEDGGATDSQRLVYAFRRALGRLPSSAELEFLLRGLAKYQATFRGDPAAATQLIGHGDSPIDTTLEPAVLAAYTASCGVILNLDEAITLE